MKKEKISVKERMNHFSQYGIYLAFLALVVLFSIFNNKFLTVSNLLNVVRQVSFNAIIAMGLLIGMDSANLRDMHRICGGDYAGKMSLLMDHTARPGNVADPWYTGDFEATWRDVLEGCQGLLKEL